MLNVEYVLEDVRILSLKGSSVDGYRNRVNAYLPYDAWLEVEDEDFLYDVNVSHRSSKGRKRCTVAGLLMLGEESEISSALPNYLMTYSEYDASGNQIKHFTTKDGGAPENLYEFYIDVSERILSGIKPSFKLVDEFALSDSSVHRSLLEALAMALISADFEQPGGLHVTKTPTVISISYPGSDRSRMMHPLQTSINIGMTNTLIKLFNLIGVLEPRVTRNKDIPEVWSKQGWKAPIFTYQENPERITATYPLK